MKKVLASFAIGVVVLAGCGGDDDGADGISVSGAWARTSPMASDVGVAYLTIESPTADELIAAAAPATIAGRTELHETVMAEEAMGDDETGDDEMGDGGTGMMTMREVRTIELPAGTPVTLEPGGLHVMLIGLVEPLEDGDTFDLRLSFAEADPIDVAVEVRDEAP